MNMEVKEYWERRKKLEQQFFLKLEELRKDLNRQFSDMYDFNSFEETALSLFKAHFSEYYAVVPKVKIYEGKTIQLERIRQRD